MFTHPSLFMGKLYLKSGFLDFDHIEKTADSNWINFIVIIGKRQVGKTYGTLDLMLRRGYCFALLRRTADEMKFITVDINNPFEKLSKEIKIKSESKYTAAITSGSDETRIGTVMALSTVAKIRGFDGSKYTQLVYDEAIPETHVIKIRNEGDAFLNCYTTISGNRELEGSKPLRAWILANSNDINAPILAALDIQQIVERMSASGQEMTVLRERGIMIILPSSRVVTDKRKETALYKAVGIDSDFAKMSLENEFSYNDTSDVKRVNLKEYKPTARVIGLFNVWEHKSNETVHISEPKGAYLKAYTNDDEGRRRFKNDYPDARAFYVLGGITFQTVAVKNSFIDFIYNI